MPLNLRWPSAQVRPHPTEAEAALRGAPESGRKAIYESVCFPLAAEATWAGRGDAPTAELLIVPVGTQPYSPLLAILATSAPRVALLVTEPQGDGYRSPGSRPTANELIAAVRSDWPGGENIPSIELFSIGDGLDGARVSAAVGAAMLWAGDPWPIDVTIDVSGGRKATTAALGALGGGLGFRLSYIEGRHIVAGYYMDEQRHGLADTAGLLGIERRQTATALLEAGAFHAAASCFDEVCESMLAGRAALFLRSFAKALASGDDSQVLALGEEANELGLGAEEVLDALRSSSMAPAARAAAVVDGLRREGAWR